MNERELVAEIERRIAVLRDEKPETAERFRVNVGDQQWAALEHRSDVQLGYLEVDDPLEPGGGSQAPGKIEYEQPSVTRVSIFRTGQPDELEVIGEGPWDGDEPIEHLG